MGGAVCFTGRARGPKRVPSFFQTENAQRPSPPPSPTGRPRGAGAGSGHWLSVSAQPGRELGGVLSWERARSRDDAKR